MCAAKDDKAIVCDLCGVTIVEAHEASDDEGAMALAVIDKGAHWCVWQEGREPQETITCRVCRGQCPGCRAKPSPTRAPMLNEECES